MPLYFLLFFISFIVLRHFGLLASMNPTAAPQATAKIISKLVFYFIILVFVIKIICYINDNKFYYLERRAKCLV